MEGGISSGEKGLTDIVKRIAEDDLYEGRGILYWGPIYSTRMGGKGGEGRT